MKKRHVFSTRDVATAEAAVEAARQANIPNEDISLIARHDIEKKAIPNHRQSTEWDFAPGALKGVLEGGATGLVAGIIAVSVPPLGLTLAGLAAMTVAGAGIGGWMGALVGTEVPDPVRRKFEDEIEAGRILVILDGDDEALALAGPAVEAAGATPLPFDTPTAMS
jgi:hypothetical protein